MKIVILYFSGTGNTHWAAREMARTLNEKVWEARAVSIEGIEDAELDGLIGEADVLGLGYPIYGSDTPEPIKELITKLPNGDSMPAMVFCTQWQFSGDGAMVAGRELRKKGYDIRWTLHLKMPNNVCVTAMPIPFSADFDRHIHKLNRARKRIGRLVDRMVHDRPLRWAFCRPMGAVQRVPYRLLYDWFRDAPSLEDSRCNGCGRCARNCPAGNIKMVDGLARFADKCVLCLRCYDFCPTMAIRVYGKLHRERRGRPYQGPVKGFKPEDLREGQLSQPTSQPPGPPSF